MANPNPDASPGFLRQVLTVMIPGLVVAVVTAVIAVNAAERTAISAAHDAGVGSARAYLSIFEEMQGGLDSDIHWEQDLLPPVSDRAWDLGVSDLKSWVSF